MLQLCGVLELVWWHSGRARLRPRRRSRCRQPAATNTGAAQWDSQMVATLYCTVLYCTAVYYTVLYCTALYSTVLSTSLHLITMHDRKWWPILWWPWNGLGGHLLKAREELPLKKYMTYRTQQERLRRCCHPSPDAVVSTVTTISCLLCSTQSVSAPLGAGTISPEAAYLQIILAANIFIWKIFVYLRKIFLPH